MITTRNIWRGRVRRIRADLAGSDRSASPIVAVSPFEGGQIHEDGDPLNPDIASDLGRVVRSPGLTSAERSRLCSLAWVQISSVGTYRAFDWGGARAMVERCLAGYELPAGPPRRGIGSPFERGRIAA